MASSALGVLCTCGQCSFLQTRLVRSSLVSRRHEALTEMLCLCMQAYFALSEGLKEDSKYMDMSD